MPAHLESIYPGLRSQCQAAGNIRAYGNRFDDVLATELRQHFCHGHCRGHAHHTGVHEGGLMRVVIVQRMGHGGIDARGIVCGKVDLAPPDARLTWAADLLCKAAKLLHASFLASGQCHTNGVNYLFFGVFHHAGWQVLVFDIEGKINNGLRNIGWCRSFCPEWVCTIE